MKTRNGRLAIGVSLLLSGLPGCGPGDQPELGQVSGTVTLNGLPLGGVEVVFQPDSGRPARGRTDAEGKYELRYIRETRGAKVGHNRVEIAPNEEGEESPESAAEGEGSAAEKPTGPRKWQVPARYNTKSELHADVKAGENTFHFALES